MAKLKVMFQLGMGRSRKTLKQTRKNSTKLHNIIMESKTSPKLKQTKTYYSKQSKGPLFLLNSNI